MLTLMKEKNITRKQICTDLGIGINQIKYWEKNNNYPSADVLYRLADYLGVSLDTLMEISDTVISTPVPVSDSSKEVSVFYKKLIALCTEKNTNPTAVCDTLGFAQSAATRWKQGSIPRDITLKKIADYFGISEDHFLSDDNDVSPASVSVSSASSRLFALIDIMTEEELEDLEKYAAFLISRNRS